ncbi:hypothetical protein ACFXTI_031947 [Malus domestica]
MTLGEISDEIKIVRSCFIKAPRETNSSVASSRSGLGQRLQAEKVLRSEGAMFGPKILVWAEIYSRPGRPYKKIIVDRLVHGLPNLGQSSHAARRVIESWHNKESRQDMDRSESGLIKDWVQSHSENRTGQDSV